MSGPFRLRKFLFLVLFLLCACNRTPKGTVPLLPKEKQRITLVGSAEIPPRYIDTVRRHLQKAFGTEVQCIKARPLPAGLKSAIHQNRYRADSILRYMERTFTGYGFKVVMLTHHDISTTKYSDHGRKKIKLPEYRYKDWAIFGLGSCPGSCCVVSVKRLWARKAGERTFLNRLKNITVHEVGHTFGLPHCPERGCVMNDANETILTVDRSTGLFCQTCRRQFQ